jgi:hypothetical protein
VVVKKYEEARNTIGDAGLTNADGVVARLGFTVQWKGLDVSAVTIALRLDFQKIRKNDNLRTPSFNL